MPKISRTLLSIVMIVVIFSSMLGVTGYSYWNLYRRHNELELDFKDLSDKYDSLKVQYETLNVKHLSLLNDYRELSAKYLSLFGDHEALLEAFNEPLSYEETPTAGELQEWLATDKTNEIPYSSPDFVCGDFAVMLSQHAKMKHWDIGVVAVFGYFRDTREPYAHAFNAMLIKSFPPPKVRLYYVEPQTDDMWHYEGYRKIEEGDYWKIGGEWIYVEAYDIIVPYE